MGRWTGDTRLAILAVSTIVVAGTVGAAAVVGAAVPSPPRTSSTASPTATPRLTPTVPPGPPDVTTASITAARPPSDRDTRPAPTPPTGPAPVPATSQAAASRLAGPTPIATAAPAPGVVVKVAPNGDVVGLASRYQLQVDHAILASRGIYLLTPRATTPSDKLRELADKLAKERVVIYAEAELPGEFQGDSNFHAWLDGSWTDVGSDAQTYLVQPGLAYLDLQSVHRVATGRGVRVALLDTGVDLDQPFLAGHLGAPGYDYVGDDLTPADERQNLDEDHNGRVDEAFGHGTHAAGLIALVAPEAQIIPYRVLDSDGQGDFYRVAEAINDAVAAKVDVINMSFGIVGHLSSKPVLDAVKNAIKHDVIVVAAGGNNSSKVDYSPAALSEIIGVAASSANNQSLASFSNSGKGAFLVAPGQDIVSTVPGGGFGRWSGTSMAAAIVSGEAAAVRGHYPGLGRKKITEQMGHATIKLTGTAKTEHGLINIVVAISGH